MSVVIPENDLPAELTPDQAVEAAYTAELAAIAGKLARGLPCWSSATRNSRPFLYQQPPRPAASSRSCSASTSTAGRARTQPAGPMPVGLIGTMIAQLREAVRGAVERRVVVLPHLDLLTTSQGGLTAEAREVIPLLYENPELVWLGFKDPSFPLPRVIENLFPHRISLLGIARPPAAPPRHAAGEPQVRPASSTRGRSTSTSPASTPSGCASCSRTLEGEDYPADPQAGLPPAAPGDARRARWRCPTIDLDTRHRRLRQGQGAAAQRRSSTCSHARTS